MSAAQADGDSGALASACSELASLRAAQGRVAEALALSDQALRHARAASLQSIEVTALANQILYLSAAGRLADARATALHALRLAEQLGALGLVLTTTNHVLGFLLIEGDYARGEALCRLDEVVLRTDRRQRAFYMAAWAGIAAGLGHHDRAAARLSEAQDAQRELADVSLGEVLTLSEAWLALQRARTIADGPERTRIVALVRARCADVSEGSKLMFRDVILRQLDALVLSLDTRH